MSFDTSQSISNAPDSTESQSGGATVPIWLIVFLFMLLFWGAVYFDQNGGWFNAQVYLPYRSAEELQGFQITGPVDPREFGRAVYNKPTCVQCHQTSGLGTPGQYPPLVGSEWVNEPEPGRIIRIVLKGLQGPMTVKGQSFNGAMVAWGFDPPTGLTDEEIAAVLTYIRQNKEWSNDAPPVTPERVKAVRDKLKAEGRTASYSAEELLKINPAD